MIGPHVFGDGRKGCWFIPSTSFSDKLRHRAPQVAAIGVTDAFLPREATLADKAVVRDAGLYVALWEGPPHGLSAKEYAARALADLKRLGISALELNIEGVPDAELESFVRSTVSAIRKTRRALRMRINVVPFKGVYLPDDLFVSDAQLYVIVQNYLGNMDTRVAEDEIVRELVDNGIPWAKCSVMYGAHVGSPRVPSLPATRYRGSLYSDDLLADAGYIS